MNLAALALSAITTLASSGLANAEQLTGSVRIIDGDTVEVSGRVIRLHGIDAPEAGQKCSLASGKKWPCGEMAIDRLAELSGNRVSCKGTASDIYGRLLGICSSPDGNNINEIMVAEGLAWAFRKYSTDYAPAEDRARASGTGIWRASTETPWDYRAAKWTVAKQVAPQGCPIKGNISENGRVYHTPWSPWYTRTKVTPSKGERWFCTEREAIDAGWRAAAWR